jgi:hypothetical protein
VKSLRAMRSKSTGRSPGVLHVLEVPSDGVAARDSRPPIQQPQRPLPFEASEAARVDCRLSFSQKSVAKHHACEAHRRVVGPHEARSGLFPPRRSLMRRGSIDRKGTIQGREARFASTLAAGHCESILEYGRRERIEVCEIRGRRRLWGRWMLVRHEALPGSAWARHSRSLWVQVHFKSTAILADRFGRRVFLEGPGEVVESWASSGRHGVG